MYAGKTLFAQVMDFLPWTSFERIVQRYGGDHRARALTCAEQFRDIRTLSNRRIFLMSSNPLTLPSPRRGEGSHGMFPRCWIML